MNALWAPNQLGRPRNSLPQHLFAPATVRLFGKPALSWSQDDVKATTAAIVACRQEAGRERRRDDSQLLNNVGSVISGRLGRYLANLAEARKQIDAAKPALDAMTPSIPTLRFNAALSTLGANPQALDPVNRAINALPRDQQAPARATVNALRSLPEDVIESTVKAAASARVAAMRPAVRDGVIAEIGATPATAQALAGLDRTAQTLRTGTADVFTETDRAAIGKAVADRRTAIGEEIAAALIDQIEKAPDSPQSFAALDRHVDERLLRQLPPAEASKVRAAATERRKTLTDALLKALQADLAAQPETDETLDQIDGTLIPAIQRWPVSINTEKPRFLEIVKARRDAILATINRAEAGSLRGRVYEAPGGMAKLEFVDRRRVVFTRGGEAKAGTYEEDSNGRILVTIPPDGTTVLTREGTRLTGAGFPLRRVKAD